MRRIALLLLALACLAACHDDDNEDPKPELNTARSVLVYMAAENNLTVNKGIRFLRNDLNEIIKGSKQMTSNQRLFVFVDSLSGSSKGGTPVLYEVRDGDTTLVQRFGRDFYSCDPAEFRKIVEWVQTNAPAKDYGLVLWGHASGWVVSNDTIAGARGVTRAYGQDNGQDHLGGSLKWMNITQMARALEGLQKLEFIFADCCNMMCAEVGYELRNVTNYLIGSPAEIPGDGAPYQQLVPLFFRSGSNQYKAIIDTYYDYYLDVYQTDYELKGYSVPLAVIDTKYIGQLAQATHDVLGKFNGGYPAYPLSPSLNGQVFYWYYDAPVMYDMRSFIKNNTSSDDFLQWEQAYRQAVPYYRMSMIWMTIYPDLDYAFSGFNGDAADNGCVSMFIPFNNYYYYNGAFHYMKTFNNFGWNRLVDWERFGWTSKSTYVR